LNEKFRLDNKISLVTGGSKGIGFGIAKALAEAGSDVVLLARNKADLEKARKVLSQTGPRIWMYSFDMSEVEKIDDMFDRIIKDTEGVDVPYLPFARLLRKSALKARRRVKSSTRHQ
jgi:2-deoxy-D-gluconate 3-dehydrogenase